MPDTHFPYAHAQAVDFLREVKRRYRPTRVIFAGDLGDHHADSYHEQDPDLPSSGDEFRLAMHGYKSLYRLFPVADVLESNHGALPDRKAKTSRLSKAFIRPEKERLKAPASWHWHRELIVKTPRGLVRFIHGAKSTGNLLLYALKRGISHMQGHFHSKFAVEWFNNGKMLGFACTAGCLINDKAPAFDYNNDDALRPVLGVVMLLDGAPLWDPLESTCRHASLSIL